jgi:hypothetical protein
LRELSEVHSVLHLIFFWVFACHLLCIAAVLLKIEVNVQCCIQDIHARINTQVCFIFLLCVEGISKNLNCKNNSKNIDSQQILVFFNFQSGNYWSKICDLWMRYQCECEWDFSVSVNVMSVWAVNVISVWVWMWYQCECECERHAKYSNIQWKLQKRKYIFHWTHLLNEVHF